MKKKYIFLGILAIVCVGAYYLTPSLETIVKQVVHKYGSQITGTEVNMQGFNLSLTNGEGSIKGLTVANPTNYKSPNLLDLGGVSVKVDLKSLASDTIVINEIKVDKPVLTYEMLSLTQNNIKQLQVNIAKNTASAEKIEAQDAAQPSAGEDKDAKAEKKAAGKKVVIKLVTINEGELKAITSVAGQNNNISVKLPAIKLTGIGEAKNGESIAASISKILSKILSTASQTVVNSQFGDLKGLAQENMDNVVSGVKDRIKETGIFGK